MLIISKVNCRLFILLIVDSFRLLSGLYFRKKLLSRIFPREKNKRESMTRIMIKTLYVAFSNSILVFSRV